MNTEHQNTLNIAISKHASKQIIIHEDDDNKTQEENSDDEMNNSHNLTSFLGVGSNGGMKPVEFTNSIG